MAGVGLGWILKNLIWHGQTFLVYPAAFEKRSSIPTPAVYRLPYRDVEITTSDNVRLRCYLIEYKNSRHPPLNVHPNARATIIMFHGNGMDQSDLLFLAKRYYTDSACHVLTVSYRGYANSEGTPSERGLQRDAQAVLDYVWNDDYLGQFPIIVYGLSIGGAVAIDVTSKNPEKITALILENTFLSIPEIVRTWPLIGRFSFICTQRWNNASKIPNIPSTLPILFLSGRKDTVVPPAQMETLFLIGTKRGKPVGDKNGRSSRCGRVVGCGGLCVAIATRNHADEQEEEIKTEEWIPPDDDRFEQYVWGKHGDTYAQPRYWSHVKSFVDMCLSRSRVITRYTVTDEAEGSKG